MVRRKKKRNKRYLGSRSHGRGNIKSGRGAGTRGGRGRAGLCKHKYTFVAAKDKRYFGRSSRGFVNPAKKRKIKVIHLYDINKNIVKGLLEKKDDRYLLEFRGKVLGTGELSFPVSVKALKWSKRAEKKIKDAGGEILRLELKK